MTWNPLALATALQTVPEQNEYLQYIIILPAIDKKKPSKSGWLLRRTKNLTHAYDKKCASLHTLTLMIGHYKSNDRFHNIKSNCSSLSAFTT